MEKKTAPPPKRKHVVMWARLSWQAYREYTVTVSLVYQGDGIYVLYVSKRKAETVLGITAAQSWFISSVKWIMDDLDARIIAGGVYFGGQ